MAKRRALVRWLTPGLGVKRWLLVLLVGITILALGLALFLRDLYGLTGYPPFIRVLALQFWPRWLRALTFGGIGLGLTALGVFRLNHTLLQAYTPGGQVDPAEVAERVYRSRRRRRGPRLVAIGGGTGLSALLRGVKHYTDNITAIVTVADDGGSSGRLRRSLGVLPPGDFRNCIAALADDEALTTQLFQYRFPSSPPGSDRETGGLEGHSFGNLFITTMAEVTGSFERALLESGKVLAIRGQIVPSTLEDVTLCADVAAEHGAERVSGESAIPKARWPIERVYLEPDGVRAYPGAVRAILEADLIALGPGSLYTSVLPNLLVADIAEALRSSQAPKVYICNVATQRGETDGYSLADHVAALDRHVGPAVFSHVLANNNLAHPLPDEGTVTLVPPEVPPGFTYEVVSDDLVDNTRPWRHHPAKLAAALFEWYGTYDARGA
ncbi:MAG: uridine diphosphate-N-acetylglucosamine-binding protein YvcK [Anaerolineae bacterium]